MPHLLIIGSPSLDTLHFNNRTEYSAGGAGFYTALAAQRSGCSISMVGPRPILMPDSLKPFEQKIEAWYGPLVPLDEMPRFEIAHEGDKATYLGFYSGAEEWLDTGALPQDLSVYDGVHIASLGIAEQQLKFVDECQGRGAKIVSSGSFLILIQDNPDRVRALMDKSDVFFLNAEEATALFGSLEQATTQPGKVLFITRGKDGAYVIQGTYRTALPAVPATVLDPTGAGDTFCGAALSHLLQGAHPIMAARKAMTLASEEIQYVGPTALLFDDIPPDVPLDTRVRVDDEQVARIATVIRAIPEAEAFNFVSDYYPPVGHSAALDYFFVQTLQQFSFWATEDSRYAYPLIGTIDGNHCKGSTYLSQAYLRPLEGDPEFYAPQRQANSTREEILALFRADDGTDLMPAIDLHLAMAQAYGKDMLTMGLTPEAIVERSNQSTQPLETFLSIMDHIGGYKEDPFRKKSNLLAMILAERPENFLKLNPHDVIQPVIDYHAMRFCLRTGLVEIIDPELRAKNAARSLISVEDEWAIRYACYLAIQRLQQVSGLSMGAVDNITFGYNRAHCPEMTEPLCAQCAIDPACAHRKDLFQPVIRTTFY